MELAPLTVLNKRYTVKRTLGNPGPYDIKYLVEEANSENRYVVREFFPSHLVRRESGRTAVELKEGEDAAGLFESGLEYFRKESHVLADLNHEVLPSTYDAFEANGTFYRLRPHRPSTSLARGLEAKGQLSEKATLGVMIPILEALQEAHENGLYHGGVSPQSIRLLQNGNVLLTGFQGAFIQLAREEGSVTELIHPGTSAVEQYTPRGNQGPWTDVYGAAATICQMVTAEELPESTERLEGDDPLSSLLENVAIFSSPGVREALVDALAVDPSKRLQSAEEFANFLAESSTRYEEGESAFSIIPTESGGEEPAPTGNGSSADEEEATDEEVDVLASESREERPARTRTIAGGPLPGSTSAILLGVPLMVIALGGGAAWLFLDAGEALTASSGSYEAYRSQADSLFEQEDYNQAEFYYNQALGVREDDEYVERRLSQLADIRGESNQQRYNRQLERGEELKARADSLYEAGRVAQANRTYARALAAYYNASDIRPGDSQANRVIDEIQQRQEDIAREQAGGAEEGSEISLDQLAVFFKEQGDRQLEAGNLQAALEKYRQAQEYRPSDQNLQQAIADLQEAVEEQEREEAFQQHYNRGQRLLREEEYQAAVAAFEEADQIVSDDPRVQEARARADSLLQLQRQREVEYEDHQTRGDSAFEAGAFEEAISAYEQALDIRPEDEYVRERIEAARQRRMDVRADSAENEEREQQEEVVDEDGAYIVVDEEPQVIGGLGSLTEDIRYPRAAERQGVEGRVYVRAFVNEEGHVREAEILRGIGAGLDEEALRVVRNAEFSPARFNGEPVPTRTTVFIQFELQE